MAQMARQLTEGNAAMKVISAMALIALGAAGAIGFDRVARGAEAPPAGITRAILQRIAVPDSKYEVVLGIAEIAPDVATIGRHKHDGVEAGVLIEGESVMVIDGTPDLTLKPGDSYQIPAGVPHDARTGAMSGKVVAVYVVEKGKPLATPAP
jgi:quercetin dioxygenase-like cupin family protein